MRQGISNAKAYAAKLSVNSKEFRTGTQNGKNGDDEQVAEETATNGNYLTLINRFTTVCITVVSGC